MRGSDVTDVAGRSREVRGPLVSRSDADFYFTWFAQCERELWYARAVRALLRDHPQPRVLEIGAGSGGNLLLFRRLGIPWQRIYANEQDPDRARHLRRTLPACDVRIGDALELEYEMSFEVVLQSLVFSIIRPDRREGLAAKLLELSAPGGVVLWYDIRHDDPRNPGDRGIGKREIRRLFPGRQISIRSATLAPPIARRVGRLYNPINTTMPFLRTHLLAVIHR